MYIEPLDKAADEAREGIWREPWNTYWEASLIYGGVVYDLGRFGNGCEAGIAYAKALLAFRETMSETSGVVAGHQLDAAGVGIDGGSGPARGVVGLHDGCPQPDRLSLQSRSEVAG